MFADESRPKRLFLRLDVKIDSLLIGDDSACLEIDHYNWKFTWELIIICKVRPFLECYGN